MGLKGVLCAQETGIPPNTDADVVLEPVADADGPNNGEPLKRGIQPDDDAPDVGTDGKLKASLLDTPKPGELVKPKGDGVF